MTILILISVLVFCFQVCFTLLEDKQRVNFWGVISIFYTHFIPIFWLVFHIFYDINKCFNTLFIPILNYDPIRGIEAI